MKANKKDKFESGGDTVTVEPNTGNDDKARDRRDVYIRAEDGDDIVGFSLQGTEEIKRFLRAVAFHGGLINDGEDLFVKATLGVPADGLYLGKEGLSEFVATVVDGVVYVVQNGGTYDRYEGSALDCTEAFLRGDFKLTPVRLDSSDV